MYKFIVLEQGLGGGASTFDTEAEAIAEADARANLQPGLIFAVYGLLITSKVTQPAPTTPVENTRTADITAR